MLLDAFRRTIFPYLLQIGGIMFIYSLCATAFGLYKNHSLQVLVEKLKTIVFAYAIIKGSFTILSFIDKIINGIKL